MPDLPAGPGPRCRFPLPLSAHWPTSLLCLWVATAGASLGHLHAAHALPLTAVILAQVLSFLLASLLAYQREARLRRRFLHTSRRAAACLGGRPKRQGLPPLSPLAGKA